MEHFACSTSPARLRSVKRRGCETGFLGAQIALASDAAGALYALWNAGAVNGGPERIYFSSSTTGGATWSARSGGFDCGAGTWSMAFLRSSRERPGDVRIAWMDARASERAILSARCGILSIALRRTAARPGAQETRLSGPARGYDYILSTGFRFPFGDYFGLAIDSEGTTHAVWGEGRTINLPVRSGTLAADSELGRLSLKFFIILSYRHSA